MRKDIAAAILAASALMSSMLAPHRALAFNLQGSGGSSAATTAPPDVSTQYTAPADKLLAAPPGSLDVQTEPGQGLQFGDKNGGLTFQAAPTPGISGPARFWSMETNPWQ